MSFFLAAGVKKKVKNVGLKSAGATCSASSAFNKNFGCDKAINGDTRGFNDAWIPKRGMLGIKAHNFLI